MLKKMITFAVIFVCTSPLLADSAVSKVYYHQGKVSDQIVFYCDKKFSVHSERRVLKDGLIQEEYFIHGCLTPSEEVRQACARLNRAGIKCRMVKNQIKLVFTYKPSAATINMHRFESIQYSQGLAFIITKKSPVIPVNEKPAIVLDCGHGGKDNGAKGVTGIYEKQLTLDIGKKLEALLRQRGYNVHMTRTDDRFIPLDHRTSYANQNHGDLFLSLHINYSPRKQVSGIETFSCNGNLYQPHMTACGTKDKLSQQLSQAVQNSVITTLQPQHPAIDRSCKRSVAQVLMGTDMPSALIELGFCSNQAEATKLNSPQYQELLAKGIASGIQQYLTYI